jgi:polyisoprenoid-binding protein YceI
MKNLSTLLLALGLATGVAAGGCKKSEPAGAASASGAASATGAASASAQPIQPQLHTKEAPPPATDGADFLKVSADNSDPTKPSVDVAFASWKVVAASFDPANLEGGTAEIEVDPASLSSGIPKRDAHLKNPDYLDVSVFPKATVKVANVKKTGDKTYTADATMNIHGIEKTWSLPFEVVTSTSDSVHVKFSQPFSRLDFKIGKPEAEDSSKEQVTLHGLLTIKKT